MSVTTAAGNRIDPSPRTALLAAGDLSAILLFVAVGEYTHGYNPLVDVGRVAGTAIPFVVGWLLVAVAAGLYAGTASASPGRTLGVTMGAWTLAVGIAQALRATSLFHGNAAVAFALVSVGIGGAAVCGWRLVATLTLGT